MIINKMSQKKETYPKILPVEMHRVRDSFQFIILVSLQETIIYDVDFQPHVLNRGIKF